MARHRRGRARRTLKRPATAFAGGQTSGGKTIGWESIMNAPTPVALATLFNNQIRTVSGIATKALQMIPVSVTRGTLTMLRVRSTIEVYFSSVKLAAALANWPVQLSMQLVPARNGVFEPEAILSTNNAADQESNRIVWQRQYYPNARTTITSPGALKVHTSTSHGMEVDVKVKRRWDRANWALMLIANVELNAAVLHLAGGALRALFSTADGV